MIICGDFGGVWDNSASEHYWLDWLSCRPFTTLFIDGNHENFDMLAKLPVTEWHGGTVHFVRKNIIHLMRGQIYNIENHSFFTMGGAASHDISGGILEPTDPNLKNKIKRLKTQNSPYRINHQSWWKEEMPNTNEYSLAEENLNTCNHTVDYIITHCAPTSALDVISLSTYQPDELTEYLERVNKTCTYKHWFFGHYHNDKLLNQRMQLLYKQIIKI